MSLDIINIIDIKNVLDKYLNGIRPPEEIRSKLDIAYKIDDQDVIIYEIRPRYDNPEIKIESDIAKTTYIKSKGIWKIFWKRADLKWHSYGPNPTVKTIKDFVDLVDEDKYGCFWG